ncbi:MAG: NERD domain-containing protein [Alistipes sp.]|nr:NERD domain-containing protein [Alistipes sp.]
MLKCGISPKAIFHDLYIPKTNSSYSQVDLVVATNSGILVFEVKDYSGWIFGNGYHTNWTQVLAYGAEKYKFYNPIKQNQTHIEAIKKQLPQFENIPFYSVVVFYGDCTLKNISNIPENTVVIYPSGVKRVVNYVLKNRPPAPYTNKWDVVNCLKNGVENGENGAIIYSHIKQAQYASRYNSHYNACNNSYSNRMARKLFKRLLRF